MESKLKICKKYKKRKREVRGKDACMIGSGFIFEK